MNLRLGLVAGEPSGDLIASRVLAGLQSTQNGCHAQGIGGPQLTAQGMEIWHPMHALSVFGYVDALKRLPSLVRIFHNVKRRWLRSPPDVFLGVDAPDFNLRLEKKLKSAGIPTVHFVGPSIWAWRYERIHSIRESVSHMLVLFPFEEAIYRKEGIPVTYVGHPLADAIPLEPDRQSARTLLNIPSDQRVLALLPGSRASEIQWMAPRFLQAAQRLKQQDPNLICLVPMVNSQRRAEFEHWLKRYPVEGLRILTSGQSQRPVAWDVMEACDAALVTSGTATLETALFKRPMVISYVLSPMMKRIMAWKSGQERPYLPWVGLPNVLASDFVVPELLQDQANPKDLADQIWPMLCDPSIATTIESRFLDMHRTLKCDTPRRAARAILDVVEMGRS